MRRVVAVANAKGGVGKTSLTAGIAGLAARAGYRVLTVDADPQGNLSLDLGYPISDGQALALSIQSGAPLSPLRSVRPNLDCIPGGSALFDIPATYVARMARGHTMAGLRAALDEVAPESGDDEYDLVLVDTPPGEPVLQELVFHASDFLIIPTRSDEASLDGLVTVAHRFAATRTNNPTLRLLGIILFGVRHGSTRLRDGVRATLEESLEATAPVFRTVIRYHESAAVDMRRNGLLPYELERRHAAEKTARLERLHYGVRDVGADGLLSRDATGLSADYAALADEVLAAIAALESSAPPAVHEPAASPVARESSAPPAWAAADSTPMRRPTPGALVRQAGS